MNSFFIGFLFSFISLLVILVILRLTVPYASKLFGNKPIPYKSFVESTEWLNFIIYRVLTHFQTDEAIEQINSIVNANIPPHNFRLISLGNAPVIKHVLTLEMKDIDNINIIIPLEWINGPSLDFVLGENLARIEFDLFKFFGQIFISWPENSPTKFEFRFIGDFIVDFDISFQFKEYFRFSLMKIPLIGQIIKGIIELIVVRQVFEITLPDINLDPDSPIQPKRSKKND
ncbi:hypothetical protein TRFO_38022 [Tritrichomonas foetus]|uniref:SMP-LTD domain-containing protein n=1 Tax=Tritrichomonas foetus TaxID=1144522 RepID=A0A1J4J9H7_9EUKA|nr:hypothetical protein TRFO_38022 [Tritrichomonas foetus]|eukprot:OHS95838.1 hypothetical protein TRFO_38022 [Tritrichomonas foetus]